jgi:hypothetical protein
MAVLLSASSWAAYSDSSNRAWRTTRRYKTTPTRTSRLH